MTAVLIHKPSRPIEFIAEGLLKVQLKKDSQQPYAISVRFFYLPFRERLFFSSPHSFFCGGGVARAHRKSSMRSPPSPASPRRSLRARLRPRVRRRSRPRRLRQAPALPPAPPPRALPQASRLHLYGTARASFAGLLALLFDSPSSCKTMKKQTPRLAPVTPLDQVLKYNMNRRGSVSAESFRPTQQQAGRVFIAKRCVAGVLSLQCTECLSVATRPRVVLPAQSQTIFSSATSTVTRSRRSSMPCLSARCVPDASCSILKRAFKKKKNYRSQRVRL